MARYVYGYGNLDSAVAFVGEAPGIRERTLGRPFVGKSGELLRRYLKFFGMSFNSYYATNLVKEYISGNPDPDQETIEAWALLLVEELIGLRNLRLIVAVGRFSTQWFMGAESKIMDIHGVAGTVSNPGETQRELVDGFKHPLAVIPIIHPASALRDETGRQGVLVMADCEAVSKFVKDGLKKVEDVEEVVYDSSNSIVVSDLSHTISCNSGSRYLAIDTEGDVDEPWSIQLCFSMDPTIGYVLLFDKEGFDLGISRLQQWIDEGNVTVVLHWALHDIEVCLEMGLDLTKAKLWDTMYAAYILRTEPKGLKALVWRHLGIKQPSFEALAQPYVRKHQLEFLLSAKYFCDSNEYPKPEKERVRQKDGTWKDKQPQGINARVNKIFSAWEKDESINIYDRWGMIPDKTLEPLGRDLGAQMPAMSMIYVPFEEAVEYAGKDAVLTLALREKLHAVLWGKSLVSLMKRGMASLNSLSEIQRTGMPAEQEHFEQMTERLTQEMFAMERKFRDEFNDGIEINLGSDQQVAEYAKQHKWKCLKKTPKGRVSVSADSIGHLADKDKSVELLFQFRDVAHTRDSFSVPLARILEESKDGRVRTHLNYTMQVARRLSSERPNLLQMPKGTPVSKEIRRGFVCRGSRILGAWDYSLIEIRVAAWKSGDIRMIESLWKGIDIHRQTATEVFGVGYDNVTEEQRQFGKTVNFGTIYGLGARGLHLKLQSNGIDDFDVFDCEEFLSRYLKVHFKLDAWIKSTIRKIHREWMVRDHWGMPRYLPNIASSNKNESAAAEREGVNLVIQGTAQGMLQNAQAHLFGSLCDARETGHEVYLVNQMHDELILEFDEKDWEFVDHMVRDSMINHHDVPEINVPIKVGAARGKSWGDMVDVS